MKRIISIGVENALWLACRKALLADCNASNRRDFGADLGGGQPPPWAGLGALAAFSVYPLESPDQKVVVVH
jgi:hypothetical protein